MTKDTSKYEHYKNADFFHDETFINDVQQGIFSENAFWKDIAAQFPATKNAMEEAAVWILLLKDQPLQQPADSETSWLMIQPQLALADRHTARLRSIRSYAKRGAQVAAAVLIGIAIYDLSQQGQKQLRTAYASNRHYVLPDESEIDLNSNSSIKYTRNWKSDKPREIWLSGEALFRVKHIALKNRVNESDSFKVHSGGLILTVTGTRFNVKDRRGIVRIALMEGSLRVQRERDNMLLSVLKPGDSYAYDSKTQESLENRQSQQAATAWKNGEIHLDGLSLGTLANDIEDNFGYQVILENKALQHRHLSGTIPAKNLDDILFVIRQTLHAEVVVSENQITIK